MEFALEPDITLSELQGWLLKTFGISSSIGELWNTLKELSLSLKTRHVAERMQPKVKQALAVGHERSLGKSQNYSFCIARWHPICGAR